MLPIFQTGNKDLTLLQSSWASQLNPFLANPSLKSLVLPNVNLLTGTNTINHLLGRKLQGWRLVRQRASASIYDTQDANATPALTLVLVASAPALVDLEVF